MPSHAKREKALKKEETAGKVRKAHNKLGALQWFKFNSSLINF